MKWTSLGRARKAAGIKHLYIISSKNQKQISIQIRVITHNWDASRPRSYPRYFLTKRRRRRYRDNPAGRRPRRRQEVSAPARRPALPPEEMLQDARRARSGVTL